MHDISFFPYSAKLQTSSEGFDTKSQAPKSIINSSSFLVCLGVVFLLMRGQRNNHEKLTDLPQNLGFSINPADLYWTEKECPNGKHTYRTIKIFRAKRHSSSQSEGPKILQH